MGLLQPILVRKANEAFVVIDGARRLQALKELGIHELIVGRDVVEDVEETDADAKFKQIIANIQREDVNDIELGRAFVTLKEQYGYHYKETAEIVGKTAHYVTSKVGLVTRLIPELQDQVEKDWSEAKCIQDTFLNDDRQDAQPYVMNIKVIEDIARLSPELQRPAFDTIKSGALDKEDALRLLRSIKRDSDVIMLADEVKDVLKSYSKDPKDEPSHKELYNYIKKLNNDIDVLASKIKAGDKGQQKQVVIELESLMAKLNLLYDTIKNEISSNEPTVASSV